MLAVFLIVILLCWPVSLPGQQGDGAAGRVIRAVRMDTPPELDGVIDEPAWNDSQPATDFTQQEPNEGQPASEQTEVRFAFDDDNLYIGIICFDSEPDQIVITQNRRDAELRDTDSIEILLDTFGDRQNGFIFGTSPTGVEYDAQISKAGQGRGGVGAPTRAGGQGGGGGGAQRGGSSAFNLNWDGVWRVRSRITARGWEAEMAIPFKTLRYRAGNEETWRVNIGRNLRRRNEQSYWHPMPRPFDLTQVEVAGELAGLELRRHRNLKLVPYVLAGLAQNYNRADNQSRFAKDAGLDV
ncbi:MAG: carbohydrate binding family 9 domain-containing protein, partial [bacterium]|nr:carbohydrate binding family 9 domain-containing protein [bacterium]